MDRLPTKAPFATVAYCISVARFARRMAAAGFEGRGQRSQHQRCVAFKVRRLDGGVRVQACHPPAAEFHFCDVRSVSSKLPLHPAQPSQALQNLRMLPELFQYDDIAPPGRVIVPRDNPFWFELLAPRNQVGAALISLASLVERLALRALGELEDGRTFQDWDEVLGHIRRTAGTFKVGAQNRSPAVWFDPRGPVGIKEGNNLSMTRFNQIVGTVLMNRAARLRRRSPRAIAKTDCRHA